MKTVINGKVMIEHHDDKTVTFAVYFDSADPVATGERYALKQAALDIGSAFLLEGDREDPLENTLETLGFPRDFARGPHEAPPAETAFASSSAPVWRVYEDKGRYSHGRVRHTAYGYVCVDETSGHQYITDAEFERLRENSLIEEGTR
jgi:hypothetical protein